MPAIITHDQFGKQALSLSSVLFIKTKEEKDAFLLGNQGPDPFFYCGVDPSLLKYRFVGNMIHDKKPAELFFALSKHLKKVPMEYRSIVKAYVAGFACHYLLDRSAHPYVYSQQYAFCKAGEEGLTDKDGSDVHAVIESELDEMMLYTRTGQTVATYAPEKEILRCSTKPLKAISAYLSSVIREVYSADVRDDLFYRGVVLFRLVQGVFHSPRGIKRNLLGNIERLLRNHSFVQAMSHRAIPLTVSEFDNHQHAVWENPFTGTVTTASFVDLFNQAQQEASDTLPMLFSDDFSLEEAKEFTRGQNFSGKFVEE